MIAQLNVFRVLSSAALFAGVLGAGAATAADAQRGQKIYDQTCVACHGADGRGTLPGVPDFTSKSGTLAKGDALLLRNITDGFQSPGSMMAMPPKGGNSDLTEKDVIDVLRYIRSKYGS
ncbi:c-type cytochrome [Thiobacillus sp.]